MRFSLQVIRDGQIITIGEVLGYELEEDSLYFWFEPSHIRTREHLRSGDIVESDVL